MTIVVNSPFTGRPVKIREKDVGKAVTDEDGGIFYVLPKADGSGYYGAPTRHGGEKDELRASDHDNRMGGAPRQSGGAAQTAARRDHMRRTPTRSSGKRGGFGGVLIAIVLLGIILGGVWAVFFGPLKGVLDSTGG